MGIIINGQNDTIGPVDNSMSLLGTVSIGGTMTIEDFTNIDSVGLGTFRNGLHVTGGNVGINETSPDSKFHVNSGAETVPARFESTGAQSRIGFKASGTPSSYHVACGAEANDFIVYTNNTERLRITSAGSVGIGTDTPYANNSFNSLSIGGSGKYGLIELNKSDGVAGSWIDVYGTNGNGDLRITTAGTSGAITFWTGGSFTEKLRITSDGKVIIGATSAGGLFSVHQSANSANYINITNGVTGTSSWSNGMLLGPNSSGDALVWQNENSALRFGTNNLDRMRITAAGLVGVNCTPLAQFQVKSGTNQNIALSSMSSEAAIEAFNDAGSANVPLRLRASAHKFFIGSTEGLRVHTNGLIGVGYDSPTAYGRMTVAMPSQSGGAAIQVANSSNGSGDGSTSNIVLRSVNNSGSNWADAEYRASQHIFAIQGSEKVRISSGGLAINKNSAADTEIEIAQSADPTLRLYDTRNAAYKADFMMAGSAPLIRNNNTSASDRTLTIQKGTTDHLVIEGNGSVRKPLQPSFMANFGSNNNTSHANGDYMKLNNTDHNTGNCYNTSNYRFTAPVAGNYLFYGRANMSGVGSGDYARSYQVRIFKNGVSQQFHMSRTTLTGYSGSYPDTSTMVCSINLSANDYVQLKVNWEVDGQGIGTNENLHHHGSMFGGYLIG